MDKERRGILQFYKAAMHFKIQIFWDMAPRRLTNSDVLEKLLPQSSGSKNLFEIFQKMFLLDSSISCNFLSLLHLKNTIFERTLTADGYT
jgi:hypothetical protein